MHQACDCCKVCRCCYDWKKQQHHLQRDKKNESIIEYNYKKDNESWKIRDRWNYNLPRIILNLHRADTKEAIIPRPRI